MFQTNIDVVFSPNESTICIINKLWKLEVIDEEIESYTKMYMYIYIVISLINLLFQ